MTDEKLRLLPLNARSLVYEIAEKRLIDGIDLHISDGTISLVMGPNGAGKSILLRLLHGLKAPTSGSVRWGDGRRTKRFDGARPWFFNAPFCYAVT